MERYNEKRLLFAVESLSAGNGGINRVARLTSRCLHKFHKDLGFEFEIISLNDSVKISDLNARVIECRGSRLRFVREIYSRSLSCSHLLFDSAAMARAYPIRLRPKQRIGVWIHGVEIWRQMSNLAIVRRKRNIVRKADFILSNSLTTKERSGFEGARVCWLGTETDELPIKTDFRDKQKRVLVLSTIDSAYKGHDLLLKVWPEVIGKHPDAKLTFAGKGPGLDGLRNAVDSHQYRKSIEVLGFVPEHKLSELFLNAYLFALPSRGEGFGLVYIEAMRYGLPVIASTHDAGCEINIHGVTGLNVNLDSPNSLAEAITKLFSDRELSEQLGENGFQRWREWFSLSCFSNRFLSVLEEFISK